MSQKPGLTVIPEFLAGGGDMGERIRNYDWSKTSLGVGKDLIKLYNDPYKSIAGGKHPWALGSPARIVWKDIEQMLYQVMEKDEGTYVESALLIMERNGYPEETYYTFSYTPIPGDDGGSCKFFY